MDVSTTPAAGLLSTSWHWFVFAGTLISLLLIFWLLYANRKTSDNKTTGHVWDGIEELDTPLPMWWSGMFILSIIFSLFYLLFYGGLGNFGGILNWSSTGEHDQQQIAHEQRFAPMYAELAALDLEAMQANPVAMQVGRRLFINNCSTCHGVSAQGTFGYPNLTDDEWIWGRSLSAITTSIEQGRTGVMPAWGPALGDDGVTNVSHHVLRLAGQPHDVEKADAGQGQYQTICVSCHGVEGKGNPVLGAPDLTNNIWLYGGSLEEISFTVRNGRTGNMPPHEALLGKDKVRLLAAYIESLSQ